MAFNLKNLGVALNKKMPKKTALIMIETLCVLMVVGALCVGLVAWRLSSGPMDLAFAKEYVQDVLRDDKSGVEVSMDQILLSWSDPGSPILLSLSDVRVITRNAGEILAIDQAALSLSKRSLLIGQIRPTALILKKPILQVSRSKEGAFDFGFSSQSDLKQKNDKRIKIENILSYVARPDKTADRDSPFSSLRAFQIEDAQLQFEDFQNQVSWSLPDVNLILESTREGLLAKADVPLESYGPFLDKNDKATPSRLSSLVFDTLFSWNQNKIDAHILMKDFDLRFLGSLFPGLEQLSKQNARINADIYAVTDSKFIPTEIKMNVSSPEGVLYSEHLTEHKVSFTDLVFNFAYSESGRYLHLQDLSLNANDVPISAQAKLAIENGKIHGPAAISIPQMDHQKILPLWPKILRGDNSELWIVKRLSKGKLSNLSAKMDIHILKPTADNQHQWDFDVENTVAEFSFENMDVDYRAPLTPVTQSKGKGLLNQKDDFLNINVETGKIGDLVIKSGTLDFQNIIAVGGKGRAQINADLEGPLKSAMEYISKEPIEANHGVAVNGIQGTTRFSAALDFPTHEDLKTEEVKVTIKGTANDVLLPGLVRGLDIGGGPFDIDLKDNLLTIKGQGNVAGRPVDAQYQAYLITENQPFLTKTTASIVSDPNLREHFGVNLNDYVEGSVPIKLTYTEFSGGKSQADIVADLTQSKVFFMPFAYEKPINTPALASLAVKLQDSNPIEIEKLQITTPDASTKDMSLKFRMVNNVAEISEVQIPSFVLRESAGRADVKISPSGQLNITLNASMLDARPFLGENRERAKPGENPAMIISVSAARMRTDDEQIVEDVKIYADIDASSRFDQFEVDAIAGKGSVLLRFKTDERGLRVFKFQAQDAGAALRAFGVYDKIIGGTMTMYAEPITGPGDRDMLGTAEIKDFKIVNAPVLASLLGAMSLPGALDLLNNDGVNFTRLETKFNWQYKPEGSLLTLEEGRTSGNALGLTFDGTYDGAARALDINGTIVPISGINKMLSDIPVVGTILSGGSDSIFAATYTIKGKSDDPKVAVNPLAALTPGLIRRILFE